MALFASRPPPVRVRDPFAVIPLQPGNVDCKRDSRDRLHLRLRPELSTIRKWLRTNLRFDFDRRVELDEAGSFYYGQVDGARTLREIVRAMTDWKKVPEAEMERYVIAFTRTLMTMNLVLLKVPPEAVWRPDPPAAASAGRPPEGARP